VNPNIPPITTNILFGSTIYAATNSYVTDSNTVGVPTKIIWTGRKFFCVGTTGLSGNNNILQSSDGITWTPASNGNIPDGAIRDIAASPNTFTLSDTDQYKRYFITSDTNINGTLNNNDWIQVKNLSAVPHTVSTSVGSVVLPAIQPYSIPPIANSPVSVVYSSGSSLTAV
jgi:hypothetical protein